ncbi:HTH-type transcriptional regulator SgrR [Acerihabitans arboris]|uniref:HTH-type transcriptional regulator SgrR n=1 Tax=Acerihabitans arboris TaxID=2691583 RepID=A0A845SD41_9GAMM|nr:HTH-type transcriptional regulator SgrR [Acerihabitans arboris]NDL61307.1 HTH-type transcriptional regulator SgrR [Acerihabitans arboris]
MSSPRLQQQFIRLWQSCQGQPQETTLGELAQALSCTRRHVRSLLKTMQEMGWLEWQSAAGRGKRSHLTFHYTGLALQQQRAEDLLEQDRIEQLVQLVGDKDAVRQMLLSHLGRSFRQGKHILRVLYYRPLLNLLPGSALRRSDNHIVRQIFSGLTKINEENGELEADLAHHWQQVSPLQWRFYLRPAIHFHHGRELATEDVRHSLLRLRDNLLFRHIRDVSSPTANTVDIFLSEQDDWLPWLLGSVPAMILPQEWATMPDFARRPVGTGPYAVIDNRDSLLKIRAFDDYFGYRALIDEVNIWVLPELTAELSYSGVQLQADNSGHDKLETRLEEGCYFLLYDRRSPLMQNDDIRRWVSENIDPISMLAEAGTAYQHYWSPAYGILPRWRHSRVATPRPKPEGLNSITLTVYHAHSEFDDLCRALGEVLARQDIALVVNTVDYATWHNGEAQSDMWLGSANFYLPLDYSLFATFYEMPLMHHCLQAGLTDDLRLWRGKSLTTAQWCQSLVTDYRLHPLFHHWLILQGQRSMRGIRMNTLGWFDFKSAWFAPPDASNPSEA